jgi:hypothetical protein
MKKKVLIIGNNPLTEDLLRQYEERGDVAVCQREMTADGIDSNGLDELWLLSDGDDHRAVALLGELAEDYDTAAHEGRRLTCHLMLQTNEMLLALQRTDFCDAVRRKADVYPFTLEEEWSRGLVLDYEPITLQSEKHVHLVVFGMGALAETVAIQAAHLAHYPNYVRDHSLRTRITMIAGDAEALSEGFVKRYQHLFDNSFYRVVKPSEEQAVRLFHKPMYDGRREDFVDVEWEFVEAEGWDPDVRAKLKLWAQDDKQLLTVVMADGTADRNAVTSLLLPDELQQRSVPIYIYSPQAVDYDVSLPLVQMARNVNYVYSQCYNDNYGREERGERREESSSRIVSSVEIERGERDELWAGLSSVKRWSSMYNAMTIPSKMRSIGLGEDDWEQFYGISQQDIELLAQVEHNRWSVEELILGYRPCTDEEQEKIAADVVTQKDAFKARKIHYDLRAYNDLRPDKTGKSVKVYDLCLSAALPLIAKTFVEDSSSRNEDSSSRREEREKEGGEV